MTKTPCTCGRVGGMCGDQSYDEMLAALLANKLGNGNTESSLRALHLKWKKIAAEVK